MISLALIITHPQGRRGGLRQALCQVLRAPRLGLPRSHVPAGQDCSEGRTVRGQVGRRRLRVGVCLEPGRRLSLPGRVLAEEEESSTTAAAETLAADDAVVAWGVTSRFSRAARTCRGRC